MASQVPFKADPEVERQQLARQALRHRLLCDREKFSGSSMARSATDALSAHLARLLAKLEPGLLGMYWPVRGEFNAIEMMESAGHAKLPLALPFAEPKPAGMHYRAWNGQRPDGIDACGLPAPGHGPPVVPDVVLVPCVGFTREGFRLGYGGGYFDRWLEQHPQATTIGVAWSAGDISDGSFVAQAHDQPLSIIVTERGVAV